jgi:hypothetical protein
MYRAGDGELIGRFVSDADGRVTPTTLFGAPLATPRSWAEAADVLRERGLASLAESWNFVRDDGEQVVVRILAAYPDRLLLVEAPYGFVSHDSPRHSVDTPTDRLTPLP